MKNLTVYLNLAGRTEEALKFYQKCFNGEILDLQRFESSPLEIPEDYKHKVMHAEFKADNMFFLSSDGMPGQQTELGNRISMSVTFSDEKELKRAFVALSKNGRVVLKPDETFWGAVFGKVVDQFGIEWLLSYTK